MIFYAFVLIGQLPKPNQIHLKKITSGKAVVEWDSAPVNTKIYGVLLGHKLVLVGRNVSRTTIAANADKRFVFSNLSRNSEYTVNVRGYTLYGDGRMVEFNFTTLGGYQARTQGILLLRVLSQQI